MDTRRTKICGCCAHAEVKEHARDVWCELYQWQHAVAPACRFYESEKREKR